MSCLSPLPPSLSPIFLEKQKEKKCFKPEREWRRVSWRSQSGLLLSPKLLTPWTKSICNEPLHKKTEYSDYYQLLLFSACLHSTECLEQRLVFAPCRTARKQLTWDYLPRPGIFIPRCVNLAQPARPVCQTCCKTRHMLWVNCLQSCRLEIFTVKQ